jgi:glycosyltransferase involved in cell wall biosynthesis
LEGLKSGVPVVTSNLSSMPEVGGDAAIYVDPFSVPSITDGMLKALDKDNFNDYREKGIQQANKFSWDNSAEIIWKTIEKVSNEN